MRATITTDTSLGLGGVEPIDAGADFDLDIRIFESGTGLDEIIRMTDDGCGRTCESACTSCPG